LVIGREKKADIFLIVSLALSVSISIIAGSKFFSDQVAGMYGMSGSPSFSPQESLNEAPKNDQQGENSGSGTPSASDQGSAGGGSATPPLPNPGGGLYGGGGSGVDDSRLLEGTEQAPSYSPAQQAQAYSASGTVLSSIYSSSPFLLPITWGAVAGTLIWRGKVRSAWSRQGYDYDTFKLVARMKGSPTRVKLLTSLDAPKNRLQLANELDVDWKTIDNHMEVLSTSGLVEEKTIVGTTKYFVLTEHGRRVLLLLADGQDAEGQFMNPLPGQEPAGTVGN
jgi:DNA-binding MarR family transcriptional regulator